LRYGSCLLPLKLLFLHSGATPFSRPPHSGGFARPPRVTARHPRNPRVPMFPFRVSFAKRNLVAPAPCDGTTAENTQTHWLTVATADRYPITAFVPPAETQPEKRHSTRSRFLVNRIFTFDLRCLWTARRLTPLSHCRTSATSPGGAGEICLEGTAETAGPRGARIASQPQPFPGLAPGSIPG